MRILVTAALTATLLVATATPAYAEPPETVITSGPDNGALVLPGDMVSYSFNAVGTHTGFECQVDSGGYAECFSPMELTGLGYGGHLFQVRAVNGGEKDETPDERIWTVRNVACENAGKAYKKAQSLFFAHHTKLGYTREALQRAKANHQPKKVARLKVRKHNLVVKIRADKKAMDAALAQEDAVC